jgi:hypothetical protein
VNDGPRNRRLWLCLAAGLGLALVAGAFAVRFSRPPPLKLQVALYAGTGPGRNTQVHDMAVLGHAWPGTDVQALSSASELTTWLASWPAGNAGTVKIVLDRAAGQLRVIGRYREKEFSQSFPAGPLLNETLAQAQAYIQQETRR